MESSLSSPEANSINVSLRPEKIRPFFQQPAVIIRTCPGTARRFRGLALSSAEIGACLMFIGDVPALTVFVFAVKT